LRPPLIFVRPQAPRERNDVWPVAKRSMHDASRFIHSLLIFDRDAVPDSRLEKVRPLVETEEMHVDVLSSHPAALSAIGMWVRAMVRYCQTVYTFNQARKMDDNVAVMERILDQQA